MKIYSIASVIYLIYYIYLKFTHAETVEDILKDDPIHSTILDKFNKIKKTRIMVFIIGIVIGLVILVISEPEVISLDKPIIQMKSIVEDVSDISVI
jgi:hypothetical protein